MVNRSTPAIRASEGRKTVAQVRRRYKVDTRTKKRLLDAEIPGVKDMLVVLKVAGYSRIQISKVIGISRDQVAEFLAMPDVEERIVQIREKLPAAALELMQGFMIEAVMAVVNVMRTHDDGAIVLKAAAEVLDRGGMPKASRQEKISENTEVQTVQFGGDFVEALRNASPEIQEQVAQMMEGIESLLKESANGAS